MKDDFQRRLLREYKSDRTTEYLWAILWLAVGIYLIQATLRREHPISSDDADWSALAVGSALVILGILGLIAIPRRYALKTLKSSAHITLKRKHIQNLSNDQRTQRLHVAKDNAVLELQGGWFRQYRTRIYFNNEGYFIHCTLVHHKFISPLHLGYSSRQTARFLSALRSIDSDT